MVTEFRINNITSIINANEFLKSYIIKYNERFTISAINTKTVYLKIPKRYDLNELLCVKFERTIDNAGVFSINNSKFQLYEQNFKNKTKK